MEQLLFMKKVDKSLLTDGMAIPVEKEQAVLDAVGACLGRGSWVTIDIYVGDVAYPAKLRHLNLSESERDMYQIRYSAGSDICKKLNELYAKGINKQSIEVWTDGHRRLVFK